jgi:hypothetical protein
VYRAPKLRHLELRDTRLKDAGLVLIEKHERFEHLVLDQGGSIDRVLIEFLQKTTGLRTLWLGRRGKLDVLKGLSKCEKLENIDLNNQSIDTPDRIG